MLYNLHTNVKIVLRDNNCKPQKAHDTDAGYDLKAMDNYSIKPNEQCLVDTGINIKLPEEDCFIWQAQLRPRSGLAAKKSISITNSPATIDQNYVGPIKVILRNNGTETFNINKYDKIAQMIITKIPKTQLIVVDQLQETDRGNNGFGSSGI